MDAGPAGAGSGAVRQAGRWPSDEAAGVEPSDVQHAVLVDVPLDPLVTWPKPPGRARGYSRMPGDQNREDDC